MPSQSQDIPIAGRSCTAGAMSTFTPSPRWRWWNRSQLPRPRYRILGNTTLLIVLIISIDLSDQTRSQPIHGQRTTACSAPAACGRWKDAVGSLQEGAGTVPPKDSMQLTAGDQSIHTAPANRHLKQAAAVNPADRPHQADQQQGLLPSIQQTVGNLSCPDWLTEYQSFHARNRGFPDAKYLVYETRHGRSGLGDRIRSMMFLTRLAYATKRVVLFTWNDDPVEPQKHLPPSGFINWTLPGIPYDPDKAKQLVSFSWDHNPEEHQTFTRMINGGLHTDTTQFVSVRTNEPIHTKCLQCPQAGGHHAGSPHDICLFNFLFKPSDEINSIVDEELTRLYGPQAMQPGFRYVAAHLRVAGMPMEQHLSADVINSRGMGRGQLLDFIAAVRHATEAATQQGIDVTEVPVLFFVDSHEVRDFILAGHLAHVITTDIKPVHMAKYDKDGTEQEKLDHLKGVQAAFVDLVLMARARCLIANHSGFSYAALLLAKGYEGCTTMLRKLPMKLYYD